MALENPLNSFATYNYAFEFGVLNARQANGEQSYTNGAAVTIIKSGGFADKSVTTAIEDDTGTNVEFFIDNVNATYLPTANPGTSFSNAIQIDFQVIEPGSVGLFFQIVAFKDEIFSSFVDNDLAAMILRNLRTFSMMIFHFVIADIKIS